MSILSQNIRNFCIIAHIDHGKSTLADRMLELTGTVSEREMRAQILDTMDLERERGITIKLQPVRMMHDKFVLNLIDTPGHVDFSYEVSRSLAAVEGAILLVDATQGIQAQTLANLHLALEQNLVIIPVINKIDLPNAEIAKVQKDLAELLGCKQEDILLVSAKTGEGVAKVLQAVVEKIPAPIAVVSKPLRALIFDSKYDDYKGVIAYVRVIDGEVGFDDEILMMATGKKSEVLEVGILRPGYKKTDRLSAGEIGYIVTGLKGIEYCRVGDTITSFKLKVKNKKLKIIEDLIPLSGYKEVKPMVFAGLFCKQGNDFEKLREAIQKLKLNDAALNFEPERSQALGFGFRLGLLGLLHLEIIQERLRREYGLDLIVTTPSVAYKIYKTDGQVLIIKGPQELPDPSWIEHIEEPWVKADIITPKDYIGSIMQLVQEKRGEYQNTEYLGEDRAILHYQLPLALILVDFYDKLKSVSSGYASLNYEFIGYRKVAVVRLDILVATEPVEALATIVYKDTAYSAARKIVESLKNVLPRQLFEIKIQAAVGAKIIASERIPPMRKDVTAKLYGGDVTRKRKLLEKQKKGKKKMKAMGKVDIPPEAFLAVLKR